jgi:hypothetical protein
MSQTQGLKKPYRLFYSYADEDKLLLTKLEKQLSTLKREGEIEDWSRCSIDAGEEWKQEIKKNIMVPEKWFIPTLILLANL